MDIIYLLYKFGLIIKIDDHMSVGFKLSIPLLNHTVQVIIVVIKFRDFCAGFIELTISLLEFILLEKWFTDATWNSCRLSIQIYII